MKSRGYCTANEDGVFELNYTLEDNLFSKLFNLKRKFRFTCDALNKDNFKKHIHLYDKLTWLGADGEVVTKRGQLEKINFILTGAIIVDRYLDNIYGWEK